MTQTKKALMPHRDRPLTIAHRGGAGEYPENTMPAFKNARDLGMDFLEMDIWLTKDEYLVVHHDATVDRTSDGTGEISEMTLSELQTLNFAAKFAKNEDNVEGNNDEDTIQQVPIGISTIDEIFKEFPSMKMMIEIKDKGARGARVADILFQKIAFYHKENQVVLTSFHNSVLNHIRKKSRGTIPIIAGPMESLLFFISYKTGLNFLYKAKSNLFAFAPKMYGLDLSKKGIIDAAHRHNMQVHYWTINDADEMKRLIANGADGILSNYPSVMREVILGERNN